MTYLIVISKHSSACIHSKTLILALFPDSFPAWRAGMESGNKAGSALKFKNYAILESICSFSPLTISFIWLQLFPPYVYCRPFVLLWAYHPLFIILVITDKILGSSGEMCYSVCNFTHSHSSSVYHKSDPGLEMKSTISVTSPLVTAGLHKIICSRMGMEMQIFFLPN